MTRRSWRRSSARCVPSQRAGPAMLAQCLSHQGGNFESQLRNARPGQTTTRPHSASPQTRAGGNRRAGRPLVLHCASAAALPLALTCTALPAETDLCAGGAGGVRVPVHPAGGAALPAGPGKSQACQAEEAGAADLLRAVPLARPAAARRAPERTAPGGQAALEPGRCAAGLVRRAEAGVGVRALPPGIGPLGQGAPPPPLRVSPACHVLAVRLG